MLQGHGDDAYLFDGEIIGNFSSNVWHKGPSIELLDHLSHEIKKIGNYPEVMSESLCFKIADKNNCSEDNVLVTNGATEAFYLIAQAFKGSESTILIPAFAEYEDSCRVNDHIISFKSRNEITSGTKFNTKLVWLCNPNNPDGGILSDQTLENLIVLNPKTTFIIDEAYIDFTLSTTSLIERISEFNNLVVVKSLTKNFAIPGLRLGFIAADPTFINRLKEIKMPWSVNTMAIEAGKFLLSNEADFRLPVNEYLDESERLKDDLSKIGGVDVIPSKTPYFLIKLAKGASSDLKQYLLDEHGLLVRDASNFRGLDERYVRICTQSSVLNELLVIGISKWMQLQ